jgi:pimeloyl-ACP methyl ester carboxylesterase
MGSRFPLLLTGCLLLCLHFLSAQPDYPSYPYPVQYIRLNLEQHEYRMAYMDVSPSHPGDKTVLLLHGKNFNGYYWKDVIPFLTSSGYRVIIPDQLGFGESDKPDIHYSFHQMAGNTKVLLDSLHINKVIVLGHSMGGMLAVRFTLMFPSLAESLILENPIGLEDYKTFVPYTTLNNLYIKELLATYDSYKKYQQSYYPAWREEYEQYVKAQAKILDQYDFRLSAWANALTYQMIYEQPVCYEFRNIKTRTLLIIGTEDRTIVGKDKVPKELISKHGQYQQLGKQVQQEIPGSELAELSGIGHIPHIQDFAAFKKVLLNFLIDKNSQTQKF